MKIQVRRGVFETNSSSVHTLCICSSDDYNKWENGKLFYDLYNDALVVDSDKIQGNDYMTYDEFFDYLSDSGYEEYIENYTSKSGDNIVAFGYYGHDW